MDEQFGAAILRDAKADGFTIACLVEKSRQDEFDFEYGKNFPSHIAAAFQPTFCKVAGLNGTYDVCAKSPR